MKVFEAELTPEEVELHRQRGILKASLRAKCKADQGEVTCAYCRCELSVSQTRLSHITPRSMGGQTDAQNVVVACHRCVACKHTQTLPEWLTKLQTMASEVAAIISIQSTEERSISA